ncbi:MAG: ribosome biogenesis GTPase Der [Kiritimatiellae bacterium]|nr:ribosome biogenesis GTPase Der [Kiritimatiellia bacterium]MDD5521347.1 ribosome biogenesis GTPase Der [Kiritimatiellia bacterium]
MIQTKRRVVVIVGRPNVGKSAIFNRLAGARIAIVHEQSGVTRDRLMREVNWRHERFELIDTGGIYNIDLAAKQDVINTGVRKQVEVALQDAAVVIFVMNVESGITPMDEEIARLLRQKGCFTVIAANKADNTKRDDDALEFTKFGFPVFPVSALHDRGFDPLMKIVLDELPDIENTTVTNPLKVVVAGRPNAGKSLYLNKLLNSDRLIVSDSPGTTRDSIDIPFSIGKGPQARHYLFVDTAGMRQRTKIEDTVEYYSHLRSTNSIESADIVLLVMDAEVGPTEQDKKIAALINESHKGCILLFNKWDLVEGKVTQTEYEPAVFRAMPFMKHCPAVFLSAKSGYNIRRTIDLIDHVAAQINTSLPTGILNRTVINACEKVHSPSVGGKHLKIFYVTQVGNSPVRINFYVNNPKWVLPAYRDYLVRSLRETFGLDGAPLVLHFKARPQKKVN